MSDIDFDPSKTLPSIFIDLAIFYALAFPLGALISFMIKSEWPFWVGTIICFFGLIHVVLGFVQVMFIAWKTQKEQK